MLEKQTQADRNKRQVLFEVPLTHDVVTPRPLSRERSKIFTSKVRKMEASCLRLCCTADFICQ